MIKILCEKKIFIMRRRPWAGSMYYNRGGEPMQ